MHNDEFRVVLQDFYAAYGRELPWRTPGAGGKLEFYPIAISELMLQQTQVDRVVPKFELFIRRFPNFAALASAPFSEVLKLWHGLGYNRRALYVHEFAKAVHASGEPESAAALQKHRGFGWNSAAAVFVYAYNEPLIYVETNIRTVYLHHFFSDSDKVSDRQIIEKISQTLDKEQPRHFYWALMDYGSYLKQQHHLNNKRSAHYAKQSRFNGSRRQLRGMILRYIAEQNRCEEEILYAEFSDGRTKECLQALISEGFIVQSGHQLQLSN